MEDFAAVQEELERRGVPVAAKELAMVPQTQMSLPADRVGQVLRLAEALEDHDDVQKVWLNLDTSALDEKVTAAHS
jgi:transcriptional/translational regulatory protein YebC/TACO1